jgi:hypothetical protein
VHAVLYLQCALPLNGDHIPYTSRQVFPIAIRNCLARCCMLCTALPQVPQPCISFQFAGRNCVHSAASAVLHCNICSRPRLNAWHIALGVRLVLLLWLGSAKVYLRSCTTDGHMSVGQTETAFWWQVPGRHSSTGCQSCSSPAARLVLRYCASRFAVLKVAD